MVVTEEKIPVRIERRAVKHINLYLRAPYDEVLVTAPRHVAQSRIEAFVREKETWIARNLARLRARHAEAEKEEALTEAEKRELRARLAALVPGLLEKWEPRMGVQCTAWNLRMMKRCWGVCHYRCGTITLNVRLGQKDAACIEYVVVHELCHLLEASHNARFHALMSVFLPDWKERRKRLNGMEV